MNNDYLFQEEMMQRTDDALSDLVGPETDASGLSSPRNPSNPYQIGNSIKVVVPPSLMQEQPDVYFGRTKAADEEAEEDSTESNSSFEYA